MLGDSCILCIYPLVVSRRLSRQPSFPQSFLFWMKENVRRIRQLFNIINSISSICSDGIFHLSALEIDEIGCVSVEC